MIEEKMMPVAAIKSGTVIDHIKVGAALKILQLLNLEEDRRMITVGLNLDSPKMEHKDLIKIKDFEISETQANQIAVLSPGATICIIRDFELKEKYKLSTPLFIEKIFLCPNKNCITHYEEMETYFYIKATRTNMELNCKFCEKSFKIKQAKLKYD